MYIYTYTTIQKHSYGATDILWFRSISPLSEQLRHDRFVGLVPFYVFLIIHHSGQITEKFIFRSFIVKSSAEALTKTKSHITQKNYLY